MADHELTGTSITAEAPVIDHALLIYLAEEDERILQRRPPVLLRRTRVRQPVLTKLRRD